MANHIHMHLHLHTDNMGTLLSALRQLRDSEVLVGYPDDNESAGIKGKGAGSTDRKAVEGKSSEPITNAALAYIHDNGSPAMNIPARPFLKPGIRDAGDKIAHRHKDAAIAALDGNTQRVEANLQAAGIEAVSSVKAKIRSGPFKALSKRTLAARKRRGVTRTKPLLDTLQMLNATNYVVRTKGNR